MQEDSDGNDVAVPSGLASAKNEVSNVSEYLSESRFDSLSDVVSEATLAAVREMGFTQMTKIQAKCIRPLLEVS